MSRRKGVVFAYLLFVAQVVSSLLFTPYLIRSLGQAEYGLYSLVSSITAYFLLLDGGVGNALVRYIAKYRVAGDIEQQRRLLGLSVLFYSLVGVAVVALGIWLRANLASIFGQSLSAVELQQVEIMLQITLLNVAVSLVLSAFDRTIIAYERFVLSNCLATAKLVLRVSILTALLYAGYRAVAVVMVNLVITVAFGVFSIGFVLLRLNLRPLFRGMPFKLMREVLAYSSIIFIQMAATQLNAMTDQVLLGIMTTSVTVGIYAVGAQIATYFQTIAGGINGVLMPGVVRMVEEGATPETLLFEMIKVGRLVFILLSPIAVGFALSGQSFVGLWAGSENVQAYWVALILMVPMLFYLTQAIGTQILWAKGRHKVQAILQVSVAIVNVALTIPLIRWNPLIGAALGTAAAIALGDVVVMNVIFSKQLGISMRRYYVGIFTGIVPCLAVSSLVGLLVGLLDLPSWRGLLLESASIVVVYTLTMQLFGLNSYEKGLLASALRRADNGYSGPAD